MIGALLAWKERKNGQRQCLTNFFVKSSGFLSSFHRVRWFVFSYGAFFRLGACLLCKHLNSKVLQAFSAYFAIIEEFNIKSPPMFDQPVVWFVFYFSFVDNINDVENLMRRFLSMVFHNGALGVDTFFVLRYIHRFSQSRIGHFASTLYKVRRN